MTCMLTKLSELLVATTRNATPVQVKVKYRDEQ